MVFGLILFTSYTSLPRKILIKRKKVLSESSYFMLFKFSPVAICNVFVCNVWKAAGKNCDTKDQVFIKYDKYIFRYFWGARGFN